MNLDEATRVVAAAVDDMSSWLPTALMVLTFIGILVVAVPFLIVLSAKKKVEAAQEAMQGGRKPRKMRRPKWTLVDETAQKRDLPIEMRGKSSIAAAVKRYADKQDRDSDSDSEEEEKLLTPEQILAQHQEVPREPHLGIFIGVDDPTPQKEGKKNSRCGIDARDVCEAMSKLDYRTFLLHDYKSHKTASDNTTLPTRLNIAHLLRTLKEGKYDDATRKKPNTAPWENCMLYLATKVRITSYGGQKTETLEFLIRQDMEADAVWIDMVELINRISDINFRQLFVVLDVVHTGEDDIAFDDGEDKPNPGEPVPMSEILRRTGVMSGIVNSQRCSVVGMTRPSSMPKEVPPELLLDSKAEKAVKLRNGPFVHFLLAGLREVEKRDPNAELWKSLSAKGLGGMGAGGFGMMPTVAPVTSGDLGICPFHCGDMTVDSIYRFLSKKVRLLLKNPLHDPAYHQGCVKMSMAVQKAVRPRDTPETPAYMHECKREDIKKQVMDHLSLSDRKHMTIALYGDEGVGKSSIMSSVAWTKETLDAFTDGVHYFCLRDTLKGLEGKGHRFILNMQQSLARHACGFEGMLRTYDNGTYYLGKHFVGLKCLILVDDVNDPSDVQTIVDSLGVANHAKPLVPIIITTTSKAVADACTHSVHVPRLSEAECNQLLSSAAGLLGPSDLPEVATSIGKVYQSSPLYSVILGSAMRGANSEKWDDLSKQVTETGGDIEKLLDILMDALPEVMTNCLKKLAPVPVKRAVALPALITFWQSEIGGIDWNKLYAVLAQILDCGMGRLIIEEDYSLLLHPLVSRYLKKYVDGNPSQAVVDLYKAQHGITEMETAKWLQVGWDGFFHTYGAEHLHAVDAQLTEKLFESPQWVLAVHESCKIDKLLSDFDKYGGNGKGGKDIKAALEDAVDALRRHPWELVPQLVNRLGDGDSEELKNFCAGMQENTRAAGPSDKHFLWLKQQYVKTAFDDTVGCTCVGFYKEYLVSGHENGTVILWDVRTGEKVKELTGHKAAVHGVVCTKDGSLATGSKAEDAGSRIRKWNLETGEGEVMSILEKPDAAPKEEKEFKLKVSLGRTGTDIRDHDDDTFGYSTKHIITDTVLVEHEEDSETINCHTFVGWDSNLVCTSLTSDCPLNEVRTTERNGRLYVATADARGRLGFYMLMTNDQVQQQAAQTDSD